MGDTKETPIPQQPHSYELSCLLSSLGECLELINSNVSLNVRFEALHLVVLVELVALVVAAHLVC